MGWAGKSFHDRIIQKQFLKQTGRLACLRALRYEAFGENKVFFDVTFQPILWASLMRLQYAIHGVTTLVTEYWVALIPKILDQHQHETPISWNLQNLQSRGVRILFPIFLLHRYLMRLSGTSHNHTRNPP